jgi:hypothetical protein
MYRCIIPFYSQTKNIRFYFGQTISDHIYYGLPPHERTNFTKNTTSDLEPPTFQQEYINSSIDFLSSPESNDSSSSDFGGFDGGDTGGGGASGDF